MLREEIVDPARRGDELRGCLCQRLLCAPADPL